jgi:hypothetical protein
MRVFHRVYEHIPLYGIEILSFPKIFRIEIMPLVAISTSSGDVGKWGEKLNITG